MKNINYLIILCLVSLLGCTKQEFTKRAQNDASFTKKVSIEDVKSLYENEATMLSDVLYIEGVVIGLEDNFYYLQDKTGSGIKLNGPKDKTLEVGQVNKVKVGGGTLFKDEGMFVMKESSEIDLISHGNALSTTRTIEELHSSFAELQSSLISINEVEIERIEEVASGTIVELNDQSGKIRSLLTHSAEFIVPEAAAALTGVLTKSEGQLFLTLRDENDIKKVVDPPTLFEQIMFNSELMKTVVYNTEEQLSAGVKLIQAQYTNSDDLLTAFTLFEVDLNTEGTSLEVGLANNGNVITARHSLVNMARTKDAALAASGWQVLGGITGDFSTGAPVAPQKAHEPFGAVIKNGQELRSKFYDGREFFGLRKDGTAIIGNEVLYSEIKDELKEVLGGRLILKEGEIVNKVPARAPRPAIGYTDDNKVYLFVGDGDQPEWSNGYNTEEIAKLLKAVGVSNAVYLQGGNYAMGVGRDLNTNIISNVTRPSWNHDAWMSSSWIITAKKEE